MVEDNSAVPHKLAHLRTKKTLLINFIYKPPNFNHVTFLCQALYRMI